MPTDAMIAILTDTNRQIGELCGDIKAVIRRLEKGDEKLADHEKRLHELELSRSRQGETVPSGIVATLVKYGPWIIVALIAVIMKLTGTSFPTTT